MSKFISAAHPARAGSQVVLWGEAAPLLSCSAQRPRVLTCLTYAELPEGRLPNDFSRKNVRAAFLNSLRPDVGSKASSAA